MTHRVVVLTLLAAVGCSRCNEGTGREPAVAFAVSDAAVAEQPPVCGRALDVTKLDGKDVLLVGRYKKQLSEHKMQRPGQAPEPGKFLGYVAIELEGSAHEYDRTAMAGAPALIALGTAPRPDDEVARLADRKVTVRGRLALDPDKGKPPPNHATTRSPPTLENPHELAEAD